MQMLIVEPFLLVGIVPLNSIRPSAPFHHTIAKTAMAHIYLGNTGRASYTRWRSFTIYQKLLRLRHPDPSRTSTLEVTDPGSHMRGSWKRLHTKAGSGIVPRSNFASSIWKGKLYVAGGFQGITIGLYYRDICCLDFASRDG
ncbi:uncharacterized protein BT62DRAFT_227130 [Guyanagaster necrorhizus]|uniref:Uncharacterized protein n=1 Tax=Guyanagaster necrorhizus TaxID=856835 RepID=A0A9P8AR40_9AGAR|nr:uncharacterized protein BT62DRAFT_227130 [Guyanagaster necrorhizus MCA 3950]KAG7444784.1 hypothetical protein BT62DRAFT_227130 [Guyanagaster necrorhizus MCA 3950]